MKRLVVLGGSHLYYSSFLTLKKSGNYHLILVDKNPDSFCIKIADDFICVDFSDVEKLLNALKHINFDGILPLNDIGVLSIARLGSKLPSLKVIEEEVALNCSYKYLMRENWAKVKGINSPNVYICDSTDDANKIFSHLNGKTIVKPYTGESGGSRGVKVAKTISQLKKAIKECQQGSNSEKVLVEDFLQCSSEHSVEVLVENCNVHILGIGDNNKECLPYRVNSSIDYPTSLSPAQISKIQNQLNLSIPALGLKNALVHAEFGQVNGEFYIFELGARSGGGDIPFIVNEIYKNNEIVLGAQLATKQQLFKSRYELKPKKIARYHFFIFGQGVVKKIHGWNWLKKQDWIKFPNIFVKVGDITKTMIDGSARQGACVVMANDRNDLEQKLNQLNKNFSIELV